MSSRSRSSGSDPQIRTDSRSRLVSASSRLILALFTSIVTARWLGPAGKGVFTTLHFMATLLTFACTFGLGEATIVLVNRKRFPLEVALSSSIAPTLVASILGIGALFLAGLVAGWGGIWDAVAVAGGFVVVGSLSYLLMGIENARLGLRFTSLVSVVSGVTCIVLMVLFVAVLDGGPAGAMGAVFISTSVALWLLLRAFRSEGFSLRPHLDRPFLRQAFRTGAALEGAHLLMALAQRADLLIVYWLVGEAEAGVYSIALTIGQISSYAAGALSYAAFPRVAAAGRDWAVLAGKVARMAGLVGFVTGVLLAALVPVFVPLLLGDNFREAVGVSWILLFAGMLFGIVTTLARSAAGSGRTGIYVAVFAVTLLVMLTLDVALVPSYGMQGAAVAAVISVLAGLMTALVSYRRIGAGIAIRDLVPGKEEVAQLVAFARVTLSRRPRS